MVLLLTETQLVIPLASAALHYSSNDPGLGFPVRGLPSPIKAQLLLS